jgi:hypothetical protein
MVSEIRIYYEGDPKLKEGFRTFLAALFDAARRLRWRISLIDARATPVQDFKHALEKHPAAWNILLKDSDGPDDGHLFSALSLSRSLEDSVFWMVQVMEAWFLADVEGLKRYYGQGLHEAALRGNPKVEEIPKEDVYKRLKNATRATSKGAYDETEHAPGLLRFIDPDRVQQASPNCRRIFDTILARLNPA